MKYQLSEQFRKKYKKQNIRVRKAIDKTLETFYKNHKDSFLHNHALHRDFVGFYSIVIGDSKNDLRAIYEELHERDTTFAYFETFGTHKELFQAKRGN